MKSLALISLALVFTGSAIAAPARTPEQIAEAALRAAPVWDGHNDAPEQIRDRRENILAGFDFADTLDTKTEAKAAMQTDLDRLRQGVRQTIEQIDVVKRLVAANPGQLQLATSSAEVERAWKAGRIASLIGIEGGGSIGGSLAVLRQMHALGARYMTLTHSKTLAWADSATDAPKHDGLTDFGRDVVREMQRIGMLVDLSHVSEATMLDVFEVARAPVIFSHSSARAVDGHPRNVPDSALDRLKGNGGIVMVTAVSGFVSPEAREWNAAKAGEEARLKSLNPGSPDAVKVGLDAWIAAHPKPVATLAQLAEHIDYIAKRIGVDHVGIGGDFDGTSELPQGFDDVADYPALFAELARRGYSQADLEKIASRNMMRVMRAAEAYAAAHRNDPPIENKAFTTAKQP
ncbi:MAG: dipeptidase [Novosphingobium sp.]|nr:dipeptidase [Novosphingobium sp.]